MLILPIKKKWFDMIKSREKLEEYREIKPYYTSRLIPKIVKNSITMILKEGNKFPITVFFRNGYRKYSPTLKCLCKLRIGTGKEAWRSRKRKRVLYIRNFRDSGGIENMICKYCNQCGCEEDCIVEESWVINLNDIEKAKEVLNTFANLEEDVELRRAIETVLQELERVNQENKQLKEENKNILQIGEEERILARDRQWEKQVLINKLEKIIEKNEILYEKYDGVECNGIEAEIIMAQKLLNFINK